MIAGRRGQIAKAGDVAHPTVSKIIARPAGPGFRADMPAACRSGSSTHRGGRFGWAGGSEGHCRRSRRGSPQGTSRSVTGRRRAAMARVGRSLRGTGFEAVSSAYEGDVRMVGTSSIRYHRHAVHGEALRAQGTVGHGVATGCMGRSRGGLTTDIHALVDTGGLPIALNLTPMQAHGGKSAIDLLGTLSTDDVPLASRARDGAARRTEMAARSAWPPSSPCRTASAGLPSEPSPTVIATSSSASSAASNTSVPSPRFERHSVDDLVLVKLAAVGSSPCMLYVSDLGRLELS